MLFFVLRNVIIGKKSERVKNRKYPLTKTFLYNKKKPAKLLQVPSISKGWKEKGEEKPDENLWGIISFPTVGNDIHWLMNVVTKNYLL